MRILSFFLNHLELKQLKRSHVPVVPSKTIPDSRPKCAKSTPVFRPKRHINHTLWGRGGEHAFLAYAGRGVPPTGYHDQYRGHSRKRTPPSRQSKKESVTGAGRLRECKYAEFLWQLRKTGFCESGSKQSCPNSLTRDCPLGELPQGHPTRTQFKTT